MGSSLVRVYGVSIKEMQQAQQNMFGMTIKGFAGMSKASIIRYKQPDWFLKVKYSSHLVTGRALNYLWI
jgi:hypothetical protein